MAVQDKPPIQETDVFELQPLQRKRRPSVTDVEFDVVKGPRPPDIIDKLQALLERSPIALWLVIVVGLAASKVGHH
jgi:hypothetical protein